MANKNLLRALKRRGWELLEEGPDNSGASIGWIVVKTKPEDSDNWDKMDSFRLKWGFMRWSTRTDDNTIVRFRH